MVDCEEIRGLIPAYSIGALDDDEIQRVEAGLRACPHLAVELQEYLSVSAELAGRVPQLTPPPEMLGRLLTEARATGKRRRLSFAWAAAVAAIVLLLATNVFWIARVNQTSVRQVELATAVNGVESGASARVIWSGDEPEAVLIAADFPGAAADEAFQAWVRRGEEIISLGVFRVDDEGRGTLSFAAELLQEPFDVLGVTREPRSGSPAPTSPPIVRWTRL